MLSLWSLRLRQTGRLLKSAGILYLLLAIFLTTAFWIKGIILLNELSWTVFAGGLAVILIMIHLQRKDHHWIRIHFDRPFEVYLVDYLLIGLPLLAFYLFQGKFIHSLVIPLVAGIMAIFPKKEIYLKQVPLHSLHKLIPVNLFEIKCATKENPFFVIAIILSTGLAPLHIALLVLHLLMIQFLIFQSYRYIEPKEILGHTSVFLNTKILANLKFLLIASIPIYLLTILFHWQFAYFIPVHLLFGSLLLIFTIGYKYSSYRPDYVLVQSGIQQTLFLLFMYLPGMVLVCLIWTIRSYLKAKKNLSYYYA